MPTPKTVIIAPKIKYFLRNIFKLLSLYKETKMIITKAAKVNAPPDILRAMAIEDAKMKIQLSRKVIRSKIKIVEIMIKYAQAYRAKST